MQCSVATKTVSPSTVSSTHLASSSRAIPSAPILVKLNKSGSRSEPRGPPTGPAGRLRRGPHRCGGRSPHPRPRVRGAAHLCPGPGPRRPIRRPVRQAAPHSQRARRRLQPRHQRVHPHPRRLASRTRHLLGLRLSRARPRRRPRRLPRVPGRREVRPGPRCPQARHGLPGAGPGQHQLRPPRQPPWAQRPVPRLWPQCRLEPRTAPCSSTRTSPTPAWPPPVSIRRSWRVPGPRNRY